jgi:hypothetical protein
MGPDQTHLGIDVDSHNLEFKWLHAAEFLRIVVPFSLWQICPQSSRFFNSLDQVKTLDTVKFLLAAPCCVPKGHTQGVTTVEQLIVNRQQHISLYNDLYSSKTGIRLTYKQVNWPALGRKPQL